MSTQGLHDRIRIVAGAKTFRQIADLTGTHHETVRRYMGGHIPSLEFLVSFCQNMGVNSEWLITGQGPMRRSDMRSHALREANASELLTAMADTMQKLIERVERLEVFIQTMETRVRGMAAPPMIDKPATINVPGRNGVGSSHDQPVDSIDTYGENVPLQAPVASTFERVRRIVDTIPPRMPTTDAQRRPY